MIGIVLAGGRATRLGGRDKGGLPVGGVALLDRIIGTLREQCDDVVINSNGDAQAFARFGLPVVADTLPDRPGPLAGILAGMDYAAERSAAFVVSVPTDTPFLPRDLVARLQDRRVADRADIVCACSNGARHPVVALWSVALRDDLRRMLVDDGVRRVGDVLARHAVAYVTWPTDPVDPFFNVNTPDDLATADRLAALFDDRPDEAREKGRRAP